MARDNYTVPELIYAPAKRSGDTALLIMLAGSSGTGKTRSALELATGLAGEDGTIGFADTENGRALYYADKYKFEHLALREPFRPEAFEQAAIVSQRRGHKVWICDNFTWEHIGPGGVLDWQSTELDRMVAGALKRRGETRDEYTLRDAMKMSAWIAPKTAHTAMLQRLWQLNAHIILCVQAKHKIEMVKDARTGKTKPVDVGWQPVCGDDIPYAMSTALMLQPGAPGQPTIIKSQEDLDPLIPTDRPLTADVGRALAAWARGDKPAAPAQSKPTAPDQLRGEAKNLAVADDLVTRFKATKTRADHLAIVDDDRSRAQINWLRQNRPPLFDAVNEALADSWTRTEPPPADSGAAGETSDFPGDPNYQPPDSEQHDQAKSEALL